MALQDGAGAQHLFPEHGAIVTITVPVSSEVALGGGRVLGPGPLWAGGPMASALAHLQPSLAEDGPGFGGAGAAGPPRPGLLCRGHPLPRLSGRRPLSLTLSSVRHRAKLRPGALQDCCPLVSTGPRLGEERWSLVHRLQFSQEPSGPWRSWVAPGWGGLLRGAHWTQGG